MKKWIVTVGCIVLLILAVLGAFIPKDYVLIYEITLGVLLLPFGAFVFLHNRCPHCDSFLWPRRVFGFTHYDDYCPRCGASLNGENAEEYGGYEGIHYLQGVPEFFEEYSQTVLMVTYKDDMRIHVGYDEAEHEYVITVLANDSDAAKDAPLAVHRIFGHNRMLTTLQQTIHTWRDDKIEY